MAFANLKDVSDRLGRPITDPSEVDQVNAWIADVSTIINARIPDLTDRLDDGRLRSEVLAFVTATAVIRKVKNPDGKQNERIDDYSYGLTEDAAKGELFLTADEWALLLGDQSDGAFTIGPSLAHLRQGRWLTTDLWVPL